MSLTDDWSDDDCQAYADFCAAMGSPLDAFIPVWMNESNCRASAHNSNGDASGIFQLVPATAKGLGWDTTADPHLAAYRALSVSDQIGWAQKYYGPHKGLLGSAAAVYVCTFLPALLSHATEASFVLCGWRGPFAWAYNANKSFDRDGNGWISVQDLADAAARAVGSPRGLELMARVGDVG